MGVSGKGCYYAGTWTSQHPSGVPNVDRLDPVNLRVLLDKKSHLARRLIFLSPSCIVVVVMMINSESAVTSVTQAWKLEMQLVDVISGRHST